MSVLGINYRASIIEAARRLEMFAEHPSASDFYAALLGDTTTTRSIQDSSANLDDATSEALARIVDGFQGTIQGGMFIVDIARELDAFYEDPESSSDQVVNELVQFSIPIRTAEELDIQNGDRVYFRGRTFPDPSDAPLYTTEQNPDKARRPSLGVIMVLNPKLGVGNRQTDLGALFLNFLPTHEISRAAPFLDVSLVAPQPADSEGTLDRLSLFTYLNGGPLSSGDSGSSAAELDLYVDKRVLGDAQEQTESSSSSILTTSGMELFLSPQTMAAGADSDFVEQSESNSVGGGPGSRAINPIDRFRPLMSIKSLQLDVVARAALRHTFKTGKLDLVLHDRARLPQVARFVRPDLYGTTKLLIEYGWAHPSIDSPDESGYSPIGSLIGSARCTEMYRVVNSSFNMGDAGQVDISLSIAMDGGTEMITTDISEGSEDVKNAQRQVQELNEAVANALRRINSEIPSAQDLFGQDFLRSSTTTDASVSLAIGDTDALAEIRSFVSENSDHSSTSVRDLATALGELYGASGSSSETGRAQQLNSAVDAAIRRMMVDILSADTEAKDPWFREVEGFFGDGVGRQGLVSRASYTGLRDRNTINEDTGAISSLAFSSEDLQGGKFVSFARVAIEFIGKPLQQTGKYDEVQLIFYPLNRSASFVQNFSVGEFPIDAKRLQTLLIEEMSVQTNMPVARFVDLVNRQFFANQASAAYGLRTLYEENNEQGAQGTLQLKSGELRENPSRLVNTMQAFLRAAYGDESDIRFSLPSVKVHLEAVPRTSPDQNTLYDSNKTILRVHIYDEQTSSYAALGELLRATRSNEIGQINTSLGDVAPGTRRATITDDESQGESQEEDDDFNVHRQSWYELIDRARQAELLDAVEGLDVPPSDVPTPQRTRFTVRGGIGAVRSFARKNMPSIRYGAQASAVTNASLSSMNNPQLSSVMMLRSGPNDSSEAPGVRNNGLPLWISPTEVGLDMIGCPFIQPGQQYFVDFDTNTTADNVYAVNTVQHTIGPGEFKTSVKMLPYTDAFGQYRALVDNIEGALQRLNELSEAEGRAGFSDFADRLRDRG